MKKILIVIHNMGIGGAQKSLLSFLQCLEERADRAQYEIHLLSLAPEGEFLAQLPASVVLEEPGNAIRWMSMPLNGKLLKHPSLRGMLGEFSWLMLKRLKCFPQGLNITQRLWYCWKKWIPACKEKYDVAIAYMDGVPAYYVMDKVAADKKVLWLHNDYEKLKCQPEFDRPYYLDCDNIITVSDLCRTSLCRHQPGIEEKVAVLENMSSHAYVLQAAQSGSCPELEAAEGCKVVTVGRLNKQKGIDLAIQAAKIMRAAGCSFVWFVVGEGAERTRLEQMISAEGLEIHFRMIGARANPYPYMLKCDIIAQPSRYEGKSIVLDEAKMLCKPIVATNYSTVADTITHGETGCIVEMKPEAIAEGIMALQQNKALREQLIATLERLPKGNTQEQEQYIRLMF